MPELPEVETTRRGIAPHVLGQTVKRVTVREARLRWPIPATLARELRGQSISAIERRGKYLLLRTVAGTAILHLGMSGSLRCLPTGVPAGKHDHVDIEFNNGLCLRLHDPRRFGALLWTRSDPLDHPLLASLGIEPLSTDFTGDYLQQRSRGRRVAIKNFLMNSHIVVGIGNIYASESLFAAGIHPARAAGRISRQRYELLAETVKTILKESIAAGGTTLRDFVNEAGNPGYHKINLRVYDRAGEACINCGEAVRMRVIGQRSTFYCARCQK